jgi:peptide/nickel transport system permease protein
MSKRLLLKILQPVGLLFAITCVCFAVIHLAPGSPVSGTEMNPAVSQEAREKLTRLYGLDRPLVVRYAEWMTRVVRFDFGESFVDGQKVSAKILAAIPVTLGINGLSLALAFLFGIPVGVWMAKHRGTKRERTVSAVLLALYSLPGFWVALLLMSLLAVSFRLLPVSGLHSLFFEEEPFWRRWLDLLWHLALPVFVITSSGIAAISRYVKAAVEEVLSQNFIRAARARGVSERSLLMNHALRNALLPVITLIGLSVPALLGGSVILESVFAIPGMGRLFFNAVFQRDYPVIMGLLTLGAVLTLAGNALADFIYAYADPRIRRQTSGS